MKASESGKTVDAAVGDLREPLLHYPRRYTGDEAAAEDLVQESLMRIAKEALRNECAFYRDEEDDFRCERKP